MKARALVPALLLVTSGCLGAGTTTDAKANLAAAEDVAATRMDAPQLVMVYGIEPFARYQDEDVEVILHADGNRGDGLAPGWGFGFVGDGQAVGVLVISQVGAIAEAWLNDTEDFESMAPIADWNVDSDDAAALLADHADWPDIGESETVLWHLSMEGLTPVWSVIIEGSEGGDEVVARVDARNATVLGVTRDPSEACCYPGEPVTSYEGGTASAYQYGVVTPASDLEASVTLARTGGVTLGVSTSGGAGQVHVVLEHDGAPIFEADMGGLGSEMQEQDFPDVPPGEYVARVTTDLGAQPTSLVLAAYW